MKKNVEKLLATIKKFNPKADTDIVALAYDFAEKAHEGQKRMSGEPYIVHPLAAAQILAEMNVHTNIIVAALLHDVPEDTNVSIETIQKTLVRTLPPWLPVSPNWVKLSILVLSAI
jgi:GTP pyrophosphokinase